MSAVSLKRLLIFGALIVAFAFLIRMFTAIDEITPDKILIVSDESVVLYTQPDETSLPLITLYRGDKLVWLADEENWIKVGHGQFTGYVQMDQVEKSARFKE